MMPRIKIELTPEAKETIRSVKSLPQTALIAIARAMDAENQYTVSHIQKEYLSFPKQEPPVAIGLRARTQLGRTSLHESKATISGQTVQSSIGSNVGYMAVHEFGYQGPQNIPAHTRKVKSRNVVGRIGERKPRQIIAQGVGFVKAFTREVNYPARAFTQRGIADRAQNYSRAISEAIAEAFKK